MLRTPFDIPGAAVPPAAEAALPAPETLAAPRDAEPTRPAAETTTAAAPAADRATSDPQPHTDDAGSHRRHRRRAAFATAGFVLALSSPTSASAATAALSGTTLTITDAPAHAAVLRVGELGNPLGLGALNKLVVSGDAAISPVPAGCTRPLAGLLPDPTTLVCDRGSVKALVLDLGSGDDTVTRPSSLSLLGAPVLPLGDTPVTIDGGVGDDRLQGGDGADRIDGGAGDDVLSGFSGDDALVGGLGIDTVEPGAGTNTVDVSTPEADTVAVDAGSTVTATASPNDAFVGTGAILNISLFGVDASLGGGSGSDGTPDPSSTGAHVNVDEGSRSPGGTSASVDVSTGTAGGAGAGTSVSVSVGIPSVDDLLGGVRGDVAGGLVPAGVRLPTQVSVTIAPGLAGRVGTTDGAPVPLPPGVKLGPGGLHIDVGCATACQAAAGGVVDTGGGKVFKLLPATVSMPSAGGTGTLNLAIGRHEYMAIQDLLDQGRCAVIGTRVRVKTPAGDEVRSYALPVCGASVRFALKSRPIASADRVSGMVSTKVTCSSRCSLTPRFLLVKVGDTVVARTNRAKIGAMNDTGRIYLAAYRLSTRQQRAVRAVVRGGHTPIRYVVSAQARSGGVATTGSAAFIARAR